VKSGELQKEYNTVVTVLSKAIMSSNDDYEEEEITLPVLKYGYRETPMTWPDLVQMIRVEQNLDKLGRSVPQQREYELYKRRLLREWRSVNDYVLCEKFGVERCVDLSSGLFSAGDESTEQTQKNVTIVLGRNDFPYSMEDSIEHWILWKLGGSCVEQDILNALKELGDKVADQPHDTVEFLHWINPPHLQSLPGIDHVHILCQVIRP
jgi:hypothetical protein